ncbi:hypothetical protein ACC724_39735, partial [Rhizobium ruizarguesonis]
EVDSLPGQALLEPHLQQFLLDQQEATARLVTSQWEEPAMNQLFMNQRQEVSTTQLRLTHREQLTPKKS